MEKRSAIVRTEGFIQGLRIFGIIFCFMAVGNISIYFSSNEPSRGLYIVIGAVFGGVGFIFLVYSYELKARIKKLLSQYRPK